MRQQNASVFIAILVIIILIVIGGVYFYNKSNSDIASNVSGSQVLSEEDSTPDFVQEAELALSPGEEGQFQTLKVKFDSVTQDNRCPTSIQCVTAGKVDAKFTLTDGETNETVTISSDASEPHEFTNYFIEIKEVRPQKVNTGNIDPNSYEIVLLVSRNAKL